MGGCTGWGLCESYVAAFVKSLANSKEERTSGEEYIKSCQLQPGFLQALVAVSGDGAVDSGIRTAALVYLKNEISNRWHPNDFNSHQVYGEADRQMIKNTILPLSASIPLSEVALRKTVDQICFILLRGSLTEDWPGCHETVTSMLRDRGNIQNVVAALGFSVKLGYKYSTAYRTEIKPECVNGAAELGQLILELVQSLGPNELYSSLAAAYVVKQAAKFYFRVQALLKKTEWFSTSLGVWQRFLTAVLTTRVPVGGADAATVQLCVKAKKWAVQCFRKETMSFCTPRSASSQNDVPAAETYRAQFSADVIRLLMKMLMECHQQRSAGYDAYDKLEGIILNTLSYALECANCYKVIKPEIENMIAAIIHPLLCYTDDNMNDRDMDPLAYAKESDETFCTFNPAESAAGFFASLNRLRSVDFLPYCSQFVQQEYTAYAANPVKGVGSEASKRKYGAHRMLAEISRRLTCKKRQLQLEDLIYAHVAGDLVGEDVWLRGAACFLLTNLFEKWELEIKNPSGLVDLLRQVLINSRHADCTVRTEALRALTVFIEFQNDSLREFITQNIKEIVQNLLSMTGQLEIADTALSALAILVESFSADVLALAPTIVEELVRMFAQITEKMKGAEMTEELDQIEMTRASVSLALTSLCTTLVLDEQCKKNMGILAPIMRPYLVLAMTPDSEEVVEDAVKILNMITYDIEIIPENYWIFYDVMYQGICGGPKPLVVDEESWGMMHLSDFILALDNYVVKGLQKFLTESSPVTGIAYKQEYLQMIEVALASGEDDTKNPISGLMMLYFLTDALTRDLTPEVITSILGIVEGYLAKYSFDSQPKGTIEQIVKIYLTMMGGNLHQTVSYLSSKNQLVQVLELVYNPQYVNAVCTRKLQILVSCALLKELKQNTLGDEFKNKAETIVKTIAYQCEQIAKCRADLEQESSDWDEDSEQELGENQDATGEEELLDKLRKKGLLDDDSDEYDPAIFLECDERESPYNEMCDYTIARDTIQSYPDVFTHVLGEEDTKKLLEHLDNVIDNKTQRAKE
ncbi:importin-beta amine-terminal domain protein [Gregarina niphandrodes]|uniref:Importin-beta amine-terminal domain protein n=1 Tax=Gregarina niphandrodes TaxID=110365 RepID=A0A023B3V1_GRENI|nr:importin-beta amine-terminal domain protein [Gregarina niphandrodes]EZG55996.1 importin-beta amine-terminal domain protein [Gregarina niphandrodes]|eukprot:XP_011131384.1 importin-beta amine-terminal domain protein [Gregarina niphandrodes]